MIAIERIPAGSETKKFLKAFSDQSDTMVKGALTGLFKNRTYSENENVELDIQRFGEPIAVDVSRGGSANHNKLDMYSTKEYTPPLYDEDLVLTAAQFNKRQFGEQQGSHSKVQAAMASIYTGIVELKKKIDRSIEKMASEVLFSRTATLINSESLDFKAKATHTITPATPWSTAATADPIADLVAACLVNRQDGKTKSSDVIMGTDAWTYFLATTRVKNYLDNRRIEAGTIQPANQPDGTTYQGRIWAGDYALDLYTYPEQYYDGSAYQYYVPVDKVLVYSSMARLDAAFGAVEVLASATQEFNALGIQNVPSYVQADFLPYYYEKDHKTLVCGVQSAPLLIPVQIDSLCTLHVC